MYLFERSYIMLSKSDDQNAILKKQVSIYMQKISTALTNNKNGEATQLFIDFGALLQDQYLGLALDDLRKELKKLIGEQYATRTVPKLDFIEYFMTAHQEIYEAVVTDAHAPEYVYNVYKMDAAKKGINIYSLLLGDDRWEDALLKVANQTLNEDMLEETKPWLSQGSYSAGKNISKIILQARIPHSFVAELRVNLQRTQISLERQIQKEAKKNPLYQSHFKNKTVVNIDKLVEAITNNTQADTPPSKLSVAIASFNALKELTKALDEAGSAQEKLGRFKNRLHQKEIKTALETNSDDKVTQFLKTVTYLLKCIATFSAYHWMTEESPLRSPQQQSLKKALVTLKKAEEKGVIEKTLDTAVNSV